MHASTHNASLETIAAELLGAAVTRVEPAGGGGNSRIYQVVSTRGAFALKRYPTIAEDARDRLGVERDTLQFFSRHHVSPVPVWIAGKPPYALMSWIEGELPQQVSEGDIDACLAFLTQIHRLSTTPDARQLKAASEACLSGAEIERQITARRQKLHDKASHDPLLMDFLQQAFAPQQQKCLATARDGYATDGMDFARDLPPFARTLIPADFGLHNALKAADGTLTFIDFEYFGWDDPVKLTADFLLHPAMSLSAVQQQRFMQGMLHLFAQDTQFAARLRWLLPCFGLRWTLILLNEFLPECLQARAFARGETDLGTLKQQQLAKARQMLDASQTLVAQLSL